MEILDRKTGNDTTAGLRREFDEKIHFSRNVILFLLYYLHTTNLKELEQEMESMTYALRCRKTDFYFHFGSDRDPHSTKGLTVEDILFRYQELGCVCLSSHDEKYSLTQQGNINLLDSIVFIKEFMDKIEKGCGWKFVEKCLRRKDRQF